MSLVDVHFHTKGEGTFAKARCSALPRVGDEVVVHMSREEVLDEEDGPVRVQFSRWCRVLRVLHRVFDCMETFQEDGRFSSSVEVFVEMLGDE